MAALLLFAHQFRFEQRILRRNVPAVFFSVVLPILLLVIFATIFGDDQGVGYRGLDGSSYYVPGILSLGVISATFMNIAIGISIQREEGVLKRLRGTPLPTGTFVTARAATAIANAYMIAFALAIVGFLLYGVEITSTRILGALIVCGVGAAAFCCLGFAFSALIPNEDAAPAVTNAVILPLYFISGIFFPVDDVPSWLTTTADIFPVKHLANAMLDVYTPGATGLGFDWGDLAVVAAWGIIGLALAMRYFRWTPAGR